MLRKHGQLRRRIRGTRSRPHVRQHWVAARETVGPSALQAHCTVTDGCRRGHGKNHVGHHGRASWISSVINLANTSTHLQQLRLTHDVDHAQSSARASSPCPRPSPRWASSLASLSLRGPASPQASACISRLGVRDTLTAAMSPSRLCHSSHTRMPLSCSTRRLRSSALAWQSAISSSSAT